MQNILFKQSMTWRKSNCVECEAGVDSGKWSLTLKEVEERCRRKYKNCMRWLISLPFLILKHKKSSCNSWAVSDTVHRFYWRRHSTSVCFFFFFSDPLFSSLMFCMTLGRLSLSTQDNWETLWVSVSKVYLTQKDKKKKKRKLQYRRGEQHLSPLWVLTRERNITVVNAGAHVVTAPPTNNPQFPSAGSTLHEHICSLWLSVFCQPLLVREWANMPLSPTALL